MNKKLYRKARIVYERRDAMRRDVKSSVHNYIHRS